MVSLTEARRLILDMVEPLDPVACFLSDAHGRRLQQTVKAPEDQPPFDRSAMDGYAIGLQDKAERFRIVGVVEPGDGEAFKVAAGECARIFTGARLPAGLSKVIPQEQASVEGEWMRPLVRSDETWVRHRGEDACAGDVLLKPGVSIGAGEVALLASVGVVYPVVSQRPTVVHITTGNELVDPAVTPKLGQIRDSNAVLIAALARQYGAVVSRHSRAGDSLEALVGAVLAANVQPWQVLLISGGASVGDFDFGVRALELLGFEIHFRRVNLRPGKPLVFGTRGKQLAFVIPGNPLSHFVTFHLAIELALHALTDGMMDPRCASLAEQCLRLPLDASIPLKPDSRETWCPANVFVKNAELRARPLPWNSSGDLRGMLEANALVRLPSGGGSVAAGSLVECLLLTVRQSFSESCV
jgi:molybdopterin molybdotransferase